MPQQDAGIATESHEQGESSAFLTAVIMMLVPGRCLINMHPSFDCEQNETLDKEQC